MVCCVVVECATCAVSCIAVQHEKYDTIRGVPMNTGKLLIGVGVLLLVVGGVYLYYSSSSQPNTSTEISDGADDVSIQAGAGELSEEVGEGDQLLGDMEQDVHESPAIVDEAGGEVPTIDQTVGAGATEDAVSEITVYTMDDVATHADASSCWTSIRGIVYDLTSFIEKHPGGARNILQLCGTDGTKAFAGQHGGMENPENTLTEYEIGVLQP